MRSNDRPSFGKYLRGLRGHALDAEGVWKFGRRGRAEPLLPGGCGAGFVVDAEEVAAFCGGCEERSASGVAGLRVALAGVEHVARFSVLRWMRLKRGALARCESSDASAASVPWLAKECSGDVA
jgi:hypothetical protein